MTTTAMSKTNIAQAFTALQRTAEEVQTRLIDSEGFGGTLAFAMGLEQLTESMTPEIVKVLMNMAGKPGGFVTDKDGKGGYDASTIKDCAVQAILAGAHLHGGEFAIIKSRLYLTQKYYTRKLLEEPGVSDIAIEIDLPEAGAGQAGNVLMLIGGRASCKVNGVAVDVVCRNAGSIDSRMAVSSYGGDIDQANGKAKKRLAQKLFERIAGVEITGDTSDDDEIEQPAVVAITDNRDGQAEGHEDAAAGDKRTLPQGADWAAEILSHGGKESLTCKLARRIQNAETAKDRAAVLTNAKVAQSEGEIDQRAYNTLERYAESRA